MRRSTAASHSVVFAFVVDAVVTLGAVGWTAFWLNVVRLHLATGSPVDAVSTLVLVVGPVLALLAWRLAGRAEVLEARSTDLADRLPG